MAQNNFFDVRPKGVQDQAEAILKLLDKQFTKYDIDIKESTDSKKTDAEIPDKK